MEHLIPLEPFLQMPAAMLICIAVGAVWALVHGADQLVDGAAGLAYRLGIPKVIVGATIISLGTTSPEVAVSVMAAWSGNSGLALGNAVGSVIADTTLIFALGCIFVVLPADRFVLRRQGFVKFFTDLLLIVTCYSLWFRYGDQATISRSIGILYLLILVAYMFISIRWAKTQPKGEPFIETNEQTGQVQPKTVHLDGSNEAETSDQKHPVVLSLMLLVGLVVVLISSRFLVASAQVIALRLGVPEVVLAATLVAFGTSLPELTVGFTAIRKGHRELLVGNVIGADILNVLFVVGASAFAADLPIIAEGSKMPNIFLVLHLPAMLISSLLFVSFILISSKRGEFKRWYGYPLLAVYISYIVLQFMLTAGSPTH